MDINSPQKATMVIEKMIYWMMRMETRTRKPPKKNEKHCGITEGLVWKTRGGGIRRSCDCVAWLL